MNNASDISRLRSLCGLTDKQICRILVGEPDHVRTLASWCAGWVEMPPRVAMRVPYLLDVIEPLGETAQERRAALLYSGDGPSLFSRLEAEVAVRRHVIRHPMPVAMLI